MKGHAKLEEVEGNPRAVFEKEGNDAADKAATTQVKKHFAVAEAEGVRVEDAKR